LTRGIKIRDKPQYKAYKRMIAYKEYPCDLKYKGRKDKANEHIID